MQNIEYYCSFKYLKAIWNRIWNRRKFLNIFKDLQDFAFKWRQKKNRHFPRKTAVLEFNQAFDLCLAQSEIRTDLPVCFSGCLPPKRFFAEPFYLCILFGYDNASCCSFYFTTGCAFFTVCFSGCSPLFFDHTFDHTFLSLTVYFKD